MADYIGITEAQSNPFAPLTSELVKQLRDNPIAIAEGAPGAPKVQGVALGGLFAGQGETSRASSGSSTILTVTDLDDVKTILLSGYARRIEGGANHRATVFYNTSTDNGDSWSSVNTILCVAEAPSGTPSNDASNSIVIDLSGGINAIRILLSQQVDAGSSEANALVLILEGKEI